MGKELIMTSSNGKTYKSIRDYHIALGHSFRKVLLDFVDEIEEFCQTKVREFYSEYEPEDYTRTYQILQQMQIGKLIKAEVHGHWDNTGEIDINVFDWTELEERYNGYGTFGTYTSFDRSGVAPYMEDILESGIKGHDAFEIRKDVMKYINDNIQKFIDKAIKNT